MRNVYLLFCFLLLSITSIGQTSVNRLTVLHPDQGLWSDGDDAFFESIDIHITPQASYAEVVIDLKLSALHSSFENHKDSLELLHKFMLPSGVIMNGASLWMDGVEVEAVLYEKGEAKVIYESFVIRRTDPLIIYKDGNHYEARIFPLVNPDNRQMQMRLLIPVVQNKKGAFLKLPLEIFEQDLGSQNIQKINVTIDNQLRWGMPQISPAATIVSKDSNFIYQISNQRGWAAFFNVLHFPDYQPESVLNLYVDDASGEKFYEMVLQDSVSERKTKKLLVVIDRKVKSSSKQYYCPANSIGQQLKNRLMNTLSDGDSFNFIYYAGDEAHLYSPNWLSADSVSFQYALNGLPENQRISETAANTIDLLEEAIEFINSNGSSGTILTLTSASVLEQSPTRINQMADGLIDGMNSVYPMVTLEYNDDVDIAFNQNGSRSYNNHVFFAKLSNQTNGVFVKRHIINEETNWWWTYDFKILSLDYVVDEGFRFIQNYYDFVAYNYDFADGLLYNDHVVGNTSMQRAGDATVVIGQYFGNSTNRMAVDIGRSINGKILKETIQLTGVPGPASIRQYWAGLHLNSLITPNITPTQKALIVSNSIEYNVLTDFTAFLALEPDSMIQSFTLREFPIISVEDVQKNDRPISVLAYPNPFGQNLHIKIEGNDETIGDNWTIHVIDIMGRTLVNRTGKVTDKETIVTLSDDTLHLAPGIYILNAIVGNQKMSIRVVKD